MSINSTVYFVGDTAVGDLVVLNIEVVCRVCSKVCGRSAESLGSKVIRDINYALQE